MSTIIEEAAQKLHELKCIPGCTLPINEAWKKWALIWGVEYLKETTK